jgi:hypothetical protein
MAEEPDTSNRISLTTIARDIRVLKVILIVLGRSKQISKSYFRLTSQLSLYQRFQSLSLNSSLTGLRLLPAWLYRLSYFTHFLEFLLFRSEYLSFSKFRFKESKFQTFLASYCHRIRHFQVRIVLNNYPVFVLVLVLYLQPYMVLEDFIDCLL